MEKSGIDRESRQTKRLEKSGQERETEAHTDTVNIPKGRSGRGGY